MKLEGIKMKQLGVYKNKGGEEFIIKLEVAPVPLEADYLGHYFFTKHNACQKGGQAFVFLFIILTLH